MKQILNHIWPLLLMLFRPTFASISNVSTNDMLERSNRTESMYYMTMSYQSILSSNSDFFTKIYRIAVLSRDAPSVIFRGIARTFLVDWNLVCFLIALTLVSIELSLMVFGYFMLVYHLIINFTSIILLNLRRERDRMDQKMMETINYDLENEIGAEMINEMVDKIVEDRLKSKMAINKERFNDE
ncbi:MAG: hypothetical protein MHMPM18_001790 [Marteilia pararefringens]